MPAYTTARFSIVFFGSFLTLGTFFLLNVVIAVVCNEYNAAVETEAEEKKKFRDERLKRAFAILDGPQPTGALPRKLMEDVFAEVSHYRRLVATIDKDRGRVIFGALDTNRDGMLSEEEFMRLGSLLAVRFKRARSRVTIVGRLIEGCFPGCFNSDGFRRFEACVRHRAFDFGIDCMLMLNAVLLIVEELPILTGVDDIINYDDVPWARPVAAVFTSLFSVEMCVKLLALGWHDYTASKSNCFDGVVTITSVCVAIYAAAAVGDQQGIVRYILAVRLGRFGRLLGAIPQVAVVVATFVRMLPAASKLLQVLFVAMYCFSALGTQLFGGLINYGPERDILAGTPNLSADDPGYEPGTTFGASNYFANNFNDVASGMVVCFELLVVNNWFIICEGFAQVAHVRFGSAGLPLVRVFFVGVYVFGGEHERTARSTRTQSRWLWSLIPGGRWSVSRVDLLRKGSRPPPAPLFPLRSSPLLPPHPLPPTTLTLHTTPSSCAVLVCLNIVVAFALESFNEAQERMDKGLDPEADADDDDDPTRLSMIEEETQGREHSQSIRAAQQKLVAVVPYHMQVTDSN